MAQARRKKSRGRNKRKNGWKTPVIIMIAAIAALFTYAICSGKIDCKPLLDNIESVETIHNGSEKLMRISSPATMEEQIVEYSGFTVSFNPGLRIPNYVVYELTRNETEGDVARASSFDRDTEVEGCPVPSDYTRSGYDRGHMAPAADMKWDYDAMHESFYMTNICPQNHSLNGGGWKRLEEKIRDWAERDSALIVVTGPITEPGHKTLKSGVAVPQKFFKAILAPYAKPVRGIAFIYRNEGGQKVIERQMVSIDSVESATGLDLFYELPDDIENRIEKSSDYNEWNN